MCVNAAHAALKIHENWFNDPANASVVRPDEPSKAKAPVALLGSAAELLTSKNKKISEKSLSALVLGRRRAELVAPHAAGGSPYEPHPPTNADRDRIESCSGVLGHEFMSIPPRSARIGVNPPRVPGAEFRLLLQFRLGLPLSSFTGIGRRCRCGARADPYGHHSIGCKHGIETLMRHNGPVRVLAAMASRVGRVVHTGMRQYYGTVSQPPPGVEHTHTPDIIIFDCPSPGKGVMVGDVTIPHPLRPSEAIRVRQHQGRLLKMAERAAKGKGRKRCAAFSMRCTRRRRSCPQRRASLSPCRSKRTALCTRM